MNKSHPALTDRLFKLVKSMHYEFVGCETVSQGRQTVLRIYIDTEKGVTVEDCSRVSHQVSALLDVEDPISGRYLLEVSSPGINRPLFELVDYARYVGTRVKIKLTVPINGKRQYQGILQRVLDEQVLLLMNDGQEISLPFSHIEKGHLVRDVQF